MKIRSSLRPALLLLAFKAPPAQAQSLPDAQSTAAADPRASYEAASKSFKAGDYAGAAESYRAALRLEPDRAGAHHGLCVASARLGRYADALEACRRAVELAPADGLARLNLGRVYDELGRKGEAAAAMEEAARLMPDSPEARYNLSIALLALKDRPAALEHHRALQALAPPLADRLFDLIHADRLVNVSSK